MVQSIDGFKIWTDNWKAVEIAEGNLVRRRKIWWANLSLATSYLLSASCPPWCKMSTTPSTHDGLTPLTLWDKHIFPPINCFGGSLCRGNVTRNVFQDPRACLNPIHIMPSPTAIQCSHTSPGLAWPLLFMPWCLPNSITCVLWSHY
jgi:hypothetical protein